KKIGVSNASSRSMSANIENFSFGISNGNGVEIDIVDLRGGTFHQFVQNTSRGNIDSTTNRWILNFRFGWATATCNGEAQTFGNQSCCPISNSGAASSFRS